MKKELLYFGCIGRAGYYLFQQNRSSSHYTESISKRLGINESILKYIDGTFTPPKWEAGYLESVVPPLRIVAWWDNSVDSRPGSNSKLIGVGYESAEEMFDAAMVFFPEVMKRQSRPEKYKVKNITK